jgi:very-short-patch-repair endonuclease
MSDHSEYAHENSRIFKLKQTGYTIFQSGISDRQGVHKVPFALNFQDKIVSREEAQKYYSYSKEIEKILKELKNGKCIYTTFWAQVYYIKSKEKFAINFITSIASIFALYIFTFWEFPLLALCPDCREEVVFDYRKIPKGRIPQNFFTHKNILCKITEKTISRLNNIMSLSESRKEGLQKLINILFTEKELRKELQDNIDIIIKLTDKVIDKYCDFVSETGKHLEARWAVRDAIEKEKEIYLLRRCSMCNKLNRQYFSTKGFKASLDYTLPSGHRADVALFDKEDCLKAIIEVMDEQTVPEEKEKALKDITWGEFSAETIIGSNEWLVKRDYFKTYVCKECKKKQTEDILPGMVQKKVSVPTGKGKVRLESENHYFYINLLLKEEFRYPEKMMDIAIKELEDFFKFKVTKIQAFNEDGTAKNIYEFNYSGKLPSDKDEMCVTTFMLNSYYSYGGYTVGHYLNTLCISDNHLPMPSKTSRIQSISGIYLPYYHYSSLIKLLSILSRFFFMPKNAEIECIDYYDCKYGGYESRKYRKKKKGTHRYSIPHENAYGTKIEDIIEKGLTGENITFVKQFKLYTKESLFTIVDFYIEEEKIAIYCDGFEYHYNKENVIKDRYQDRELQYLGHKVLRFTGSEIVGNPGKCIEEIKRFINKFSSAQ